MARFSAADLDFGRAGIVGEFWTSGRVSESQYLDNPGSTTGTISGPACFVQIRAIRVSPPHPCASVVKIFRRNPLILSSIEKYGTP
jgi:hypothetical protein